MSSADWVVSGSNDELQRSEKEYRWNFVDKVEFWSFNCNFKESMWKQLLKDDHVADKSWCVQYML